MALEDENKVPSISNSSCDDYCEYDDENSITSKLMHKYTSLLSRKNFTSISLLAYSRNLKT